MKEDASTPPAYTAPVRVKAIRAELDRAANEYVEAHKVYQETLVHFRAARQRFASVKRVAAEILSFTDWYDWQEHHGNVRYAAMTIGEAIREVLREKAFEAAAEAGHSQPASATHFFPSMTMEQIIEALEAGNFEFKGAPRRETHAALLKLEGVIRNDEKDEFTIEDANEILQMVMTHFSDEGSASSEAEHGKGKEGSTISA